MSIKVCTSEHVISTTAGMAMRRTWFPSYLKGAYLLSTKDGEIQRSPDPVTMIEGDLAFYNNSPAALDVWVTVQRAPRSIVTTQPGTVILQEAYTFDVGIDPSAEEPSVFRDAFGGKMQTDKAATSGKDLKYGRYFLDDLDSLVKVPCGTVPAEQGLHFRYICAVQTPGVWTTPTEEPPRYEANARYVRLFADSLPVLEVEES